MPKKSILILTIILSLLVTTFFLSGCSFRQKGLYNYVNVPVSGATGNALKPAQVRQAIISACQNKGWVPRETSPGVITATIDLRAHHAVVEIPYNGQSYSISYKDSMNLNYDPVGHTIHNQYNNWVSYLKQEIDRELASYK